MKLLIIVINLFFHLRNNDICFNLAIRIDIIINYAFGRYTDNTMDNASTMEEKQRKLKLFQTFIAELFADRKSGFEVKSVPHEVNINWAKYDSEFNDEEMACLRAFSRIAFFMARQPYEELLNCYEWDLANKSYKTEKDILEYFTLAAGSFGAMCIFSFMYRYSIDKYEFVEKDNYVLSKSYQLGQVCYFFIIFTVFILIYMYSYFLRAYNS